VNGTVVGPTSCHRACRTFDLRAVQWMCTIPRSWPRDNVNSEFQFFRSSVALLGFSLGSASGFAVGAESNTSVNRRSRNCDEVTSRKFVISGFLITTTGPSLHVRSLYFIYKTTENTSRMNIHGTTQALAAIVV